MAAISDFDVQSVGHILERPDKSTWMSAEIIRAIYHGPDAARVLWRKGFPDHVRVVEDFERSDKAVHPPRVSDNNAAHLLSMMAKADQLTLLQFVVSFPGASKVFQAYGHGMYRTWKEAVDAVPTSEVLFENELFDPMQEV